MEWARVLAYITGTVDQEMLLRNEYLAAENRILKAQFNGRLTLSDTEKPKCTTLLGRNCAPKKIAPVMGSDVVLGASPHPAETVQQPIFFQRFVQARNGREWRRDNALLRIGRQKQERYASALQFFGDGPDHLPRKVYVEHCGIQRFRVSEFKRHGETVRRSDDHATRAFEDIRRCERDESSSTTKTRRPTKVIPCLHAAILRSLAGEKPA